VIGLRGRASIAGGALMIIAGLAIPSATTTPVAAAAVSAQGTDVSSLQHLSNPTINSAGVSSAGMSFVGIKASEGNYYTNPYYAGNTTKNYEADAAEAVAAGLYVTPYVFANPYPGDGTAAGQADYAANVINASTSPAYASSQMQSGKCLDVPVASAANGTQPALWSCANLTNQPNEHWNRPAASVLSGEPGKCLAASGAAVVMASCANVASQQWTTESDGTFRLSGECLTETGAAGSGLSIGSCNGTEATEWELVAAGPIATEIASAASGLCVTVPSSGTKLLIEPCAATPAATWQVE
jgi:Ricin-type beta-trefoil lectin domain/Glycosyl hydrolases family 25